MNKIIISNSSHPRFEEIKKLDGFIQWEDLNDEKADFVLDLTALKTEEKKSLFEKFNCPVVSDLSLNSGHLLFEEYPQLKAAVATVFPSPNQKCEVFYKDQEVKSELLNTLESLDLKPVEVSCSGIGFIFGRTVVQIMNEAWFSIEDDLAEEDAIDTAMLYGVNYPKGPILWSKESGLTNVVALLEELYNQTKQDRYIVAPNLKEASL